MTSIGVGGAKSADDEPCDICGHPFPPHAFVSFNPNEGGIMLCDMAGCDCISTWSRSGMPRPEQDLVRLLLRAAADKRGYTEMWIDYMMERLYNK